MSAARVRAPRAEAAVAPRRDRRSRGVGGRRAPRSSRARLPKRAPPVRASPARVARPPPRARSPRALPRAPARARRGRWSRAPSARPVHEKPQDVGLGASASRPILDAGRPAPRRARTNPPRAPSPLPPPRAQRTLLGGRHARHRSRLLAAASSAARAGRRRPRSAPGAATSSASPCSPRRFPVPAALRAAPPTTSQVRRRGDDGRGPQGPRHPRPRASEHRRHPPHPRPRRRPRRSTSGSPRLASSPCSRRASRVTAAATMEIVEMARQGEQVAGESHQRRRRAGGGRVRQGREHAAGEDRDPERGSSATPRAAWTRACWKSGRARATCPSSPRWRWTRTARL